ncbi:MAG: hypothetical protein L0Z68_06540 [Gammaproteobacteria bacterium]|nr:hypothetical protein [Gammaproteobacteria bacterium]
MIGTPPNVIIATHRTEIVGHSFEMFDYLPVGVVVALAGVALFRIVGWHLIPKERQAHNWPL